MPVISILFISAPGKRAECQDRWGVRMCPEAMPLGLGKVNHSARVDCTRSDTDKSSREGIGNPIWVIPS